MELAQVGRALARVRVHPRPDHRDRALDPPRLVVLRRCRSAGPEPLHAFVMVLSYPRKPAVVWSWDEQLLAWLACHNGAYRRLGGVAAVNGVDNVKTAMVSGAGACAVRRIRAAG